MATDNELTRIAGMAAALRPDWNASSVRAYLGKHFREHTYQDLAVALAACATDPHTATPARVSEAGYWWKTTGVLAGRSEVPEVGPGRGVRHCDRARHEHEAHGTCRLCRAERLAGDEPERPAPTVPARDGWREIGRVTA